MLVRDNTRSYLGEYSVKLAMEGDVFYSIGKESPEVQYSWDDNNVSFLSS